MQEELFNNEAAKAKRSSLEIQIDNVKNKLSKTSDLREQLEAKMCIKLIERISVEDTGTFVITTSDQKMFMSSKVMQMFSPLLRGLVADTSSVGRSDKKDPSSGYSVSTNYT